MNKDVWLIFGGERENIDGKSGEFVKLVELDRKKREKGRRKSNTSRKKAGHVARRETQGAAKFLFLKGEIHTVCHTKKKGYPMQSKRQKKVTSGCPNRWRKRVKT